MHGSNRMYEGRLTSHSTGLYGDKFGDKGFVAQRVRLKEGLRVPSLSSQLMLDLSWLIF